MAEELLEALARRLAGEPLDGRSDPPWDDLDPLMQAYYRALAQVAVDFITSSS